MLDYTIQEKRRDLSRSSHIWYRQTPRKKMNRETNTPRCRIYEDNVYSREAVHRLHIRKNRMSVALFLPFLLKFWRFRYVGKSKKRILDPRISPLRHCKVTNNILLSTKMRNYFHKTMQTLNGDNCFSVTK